MAYVGRGAKTQILAVKLGYPRKTDKQTCKMFPNNNHGQGSRQRPTLRLVLCEIHFAPPFRNPRMMSGLQIPTNNGCPWFRSGASGFRPSTGRDAGVLPSFRGRSLTRRQFLFLLRRWRYWNGRHARTCMREFAGNVGSTGRLDQQSWQTQERVLPKTF